MFTRSMLAAAALALLASPLAQGAGVVSASAQFDSALNYLTQADAERDAGSVEDAVILYNDAVEKYAALAGRFPDWQPSVVQFRIAYCKEQVRLLKKQKQPAGVTNAAPAAAEPAKADVVRRANLAAIKSRAAALLREGDPGSARPLLLDALRIDPDDAGVRLMLAIAQCQAGAYSDAALVLRALIAEEPTNAVAHLSLGAAYLGQGRLEDAAVETTIGLNLNAKEPAGHYNMARILMQMAPPDMAKAKASYEKYLSLGGKPHPSLQAAFAPAAGKAATHAPAPAPTHQ